MKQINKQYGSLSIEMGIICTLMVATSISIMGAIKDAHYDELITSHQLLNHIALKSAEQVIVDGCLHGKADDENVTNGQTDLGCDFDFGDLVHDDFLIQNQNEHGLNTVLVD